MRESDIVRDILNYCNQAGIFARRRNVAGIQRMKGHFVRLGTKGESDIWFILRGGRHGECEVKRPGEVPSDEQVRWLTECHALGCVAFWVTSLDEFVEKLNHATRNP